MVKASTAAMIGGVVALGGYYFLHKKYPNTIPALGNNINSAIVHKMANENTTLRRTTNELLQKLVAIPDYVERQKRYGAMPITDVAERQRKFGAMPFDQHSDKTTREHYFGFAGTRAPSSYESFGMVDGVRSYSPATFPTPRPGTIIHHPQAMPYSPPNITSRLLNSAERQHTYSFMGNYIPHSSKTAELFSMN